MSARNESARNKQLVSDAAIRDVLRRELQRALHIEKTFTRQSLANESGVSIDIIDAIISRDAAKHRRLKIDDVFSLCHELGGRAVNALLSAIAYGAYPLDEAGAPNLSEIVPGGMEHFAVIARALADGKVDEDEKPDVTVAADALVDTVTPLSSRRREA